MHRINLFLYNLLFLISLPLCLLLIKIFRKKSFYRWRERLAMIKVPQCDVLVHSVSVGETNVFLPLLNKLQEENKDLSVCITCSSFAASKIIKDRLGDRVFHCFLPLDLYPLMASFINRLKPKVCIIVEREIWPSMLFLLKKQQAKVVVANARLSRASFEKYNKFAFVRDLCFSNITNILAQTQKEADFYKHLAPNVDIMVSGSMKYDLEQILIQKEDIMSLHALWKNRPVWIAASTHLLELPIILQAHKKILKKFDDALLLVFPRKDFDFNSSIKLVDDFGFTYSLRSQKDDFVKQQVFIGDCIGELRQFYLTCDIAFIGGSLFNFGGHNPLEAAMAKLPTLMGSYQESCLEVCRKLQASGNLTVVKDSNELANSVIDYLLDSNCRINAGLQGFGLIESNKGSTNKHYEVISLALNA